MKLALSRRCAGHEVHLASLPVLSNPKNQLQLRCTAVATVAIGLSKPPSAASGSAETGEYLHKKQADEHPVGDDFILDVFQDSVFSVFNIRIRL